MGTCVGSCQDAQDKLLWRDKACPARTYLIMSWKLTILIILIVVLLLLL